jgi:hypothetical protein
MEESISCEISSSHGGEYDVQSCVVGFYKVEKIFLLPPQKQK